MWYEAVAFCRWLQEQIANRTWQVWLNGQVKACRVEPQNVTIRLPSEAEWEKAARGTDGRRFPWGPEADPNRANYDHTGIGTTSAVGCFPGGASPYGVEDLSGNVWERCATKWEDDYRDYKGDNSLEGHAIRVLRGGSFASGHRYVRCGARFVYNPDFRYRDIGFRVVATPVHL